MAEPPSQETIDRMHRWFGVECNNGCWGLIEKSGRTTTEDRDMLYMAYAAAYHWGFAGTALNGARAEQTLSHVHSLLGQGDLALVYARRCLDYCEQNECEDWDLAFANMSVAFAYAVLGEAEQQRRHYAAAQRLGESIKDKEDRQVFFEVFTKIPQPDH